MKQKLIQFMQGRYGVDQLSKFLTWTSLIIVFMSSFVGGMILNVLGVSGFIYAYYRILSKNHPKRYQENQKFMILVNRVKGVISRNKNMGKQRKTHHIYKCPNCKQKIRIPKGKGKIEVRCPKCQKTFLRKS